MLCDQPTATTELEKFQAVDAGNGKINLVGGGGKFCGLRASKHIQCDHDTAEGSVDEFRVVTEDPLATAGQHFSLGHQTIGLINEKNGEYCYPHATNGLYCNRPWLRGSERFQIARLDGLPVDAVEPCVGLPACKAGGRGSTLDADTVSPGAPNKHICLGVPNLEF